MKKKLLLPLSFGVLTSINAYSSDIDDTVYEVKSGDSFSLIAKKITQKLYPEASYLNKEYKRTFEVLKRANPQVSNINHLFVGQRLNIPHELVIDDERIITKYKVKYSDTLYKVVRRLLADEDPWEVIGLLKKFNPSLSNVNFIREGEVLRVPSADYISSVNNRSKVKVSSHVKEEATPRFRKSFLLREEIYYLENEQVKEIVKLFRQIVKSKEKQSVLKGLKASLDLSRTYKKSHLEEAFLSLISTSLKAKNTDNYLNEVKSFFGLWKEVRKEKRYNTAQVNSRFSNRLD